MELNETVKIRYEYDARSVTQGAKQTELALRQEARAITASARAIDKKIIELRKLEKPDKEMIQRLQAKSRELKINAQAVRANISAVRDSAAAQKLAAQETRGYSVAAKSATLATNGLKVAFRQLLLPVAGLVTAFGGFKLIQMADDFKLLQARIKGATDSTVEYERVSKGLIAASRQTGNALKESVDIFQRLSFSKNDIKATADEMVKVTKAAEQLAVISGTDSEGQKFGLRQFGQALSAGIVRAEEFNSVLENLPALATELADRLGYDTVGALRNAVVTGNVLSKDVFNALLLATDDINQRFEELPPNMERSFNSFKVFLSELVGKIDVATGTTSGLAGAIDEFTSYLTENQDELVDFATNLAKAAEATVRLTEEIGGLVNAFGLLEGAGKIAGSIAEGAGNAFDFAADGLRFQRLDRQASAEQNPAKRRSLQKAALSDLFKNQRSYFLSPDTQFFARLRYGDTLIDEVVSETEKAILDGAIEQGSKNAAEKVKKEKAKLQRSASAGGKTKKTPAAPAFPLGGGYDINNVPITSGFRTRARPNHNGVDFGARAGTPVLSAEPGVVRIWTEAGGGNVVEVTSQRLGHEVVNRYLHLASQTVRTGDTVARGQQVGTVGNTGRSRGAHLHQRTLVDGKDVNPLDYLQGKYGNTRIEGTLESAARKAQTEEEKRKREAIKASKDAYDKLLLSQGNLLSEVELKTDKARLSLGEYASETQKAAVELEGLNEKLAVLRDTKSKLAEQGKDPLLEAEKVQKDLLETQEKIVEAQAKSLKIRQDIAHKGGELSDKFGEALRGNKQNQVEIDNAQELKRIETETLRREQELQQAFENKTITATQYYTELQTLADRTATKQIQGEQRVLELLREQVAELQAQRDFSAATGESRDDILNTDIRILQVQQEISRTEANISNLQQDQKQKKNSLSAQLVSQKASFRKEIFGDLQNVIVGSLGSLFQGGGGGQAAQQAFGGLSNIAGKFLGQGIGKLAGAIGGKLGAALGSFAPGIGTAIGAVVGTVGGGFLGKLFGGGKQRKQAAEQYQIAHYQAEVRNILRGVNTRQLDYRNLESQLGKLTSLRRPPNAQVRAIIDQGIEQIQQLKEQRQDQINQVTQQAADERDAAVYDRMRLEAGKNTFQVANLNRAQELTNLQVETARQLQQFQDSQMAMTAIVQREAEKRKLIELEYRKAIEQAQEELDDSFKKASLDLEALLLRRQEISDSNIFQRAKSAEQRKSEELAKVDKQIAQAFKDLNELLANGGTPNDPAGIASLSLLKSAAGAAGQLAEKIEFIINSPDGDPVKIASEVKRQLEQFARKNLGTSLLAG